MRKQGKWNPKLKDCSYSGLNKSMNFNPDLEGGSNKISVTTKLYVKVDYNDGLDLKINPTNDEVPGIGGRPEGVNLSIFPNTPTYFQSIPISPKPISENNSTKTADFNFANPNLHPMKSPNYDHFRRNEFRVPTPGSLKHELPFRPNFGSTNRPHINPATSLRQVFGNATSNKNEKSNNDATDNDNSHNNQADDSKPQPPKLGPKGLELDINGITSGYMTGNPFGTPSPLNFPQSCNSNSIFPPNTPDDAKFPALDSSKHFNSRFNREGGIGNMFAPIPSPNAFFENRSGPKNFPISPGGGMFTPFSSNLHQKDGKK